MVRLSAVAIKIADNPIGASFSGWPRTHLPWVQAMQVWCQKIPDALVLQRTCVAPGILRSAAVTPQLMNSVSTSTMAALMIAVT